MPILSSEVPAWPPREAGQEYGPREGWPQPGTVSKTGWYEDRVGGLLIPQVGGQLGGSQGCSLPSPETSLVPLVSFIGFF